MLYIYYSKINENLNINIDDFPQVVKDHLLKKKNEKTYQVSKLSWYILDTLLKKYFKKNLDEINVSFTKNGKPISEDIYFSISHSNRIVCIAISDNNVGIDIECLKPIDNLEKLVYTLFKELPFNSNDLLLNFYLAYTSYEAYIKYNNLTLGYPKNKLYIRDDCVSNIIEVENEKYVLSYLSNEIAKIKEIIV